MSTCKYNLYNNKCLDGRIRLEYAGSEAGEVQNGFISKSNQWKWLRKNKTSTHKQKMIIGLMLDCKWKDNYIFARS